MRHHISESSCEGAASPVRAVVRNLSMDPAYLYRIQSNLLKIRAYNDQIDINISRIGKA